MGFFLLLALVLGIIIWFNFWGADTDKEKANALTNSIGFSVVAVLIVGIIWCVSYGNTVKMARHLSVIEQYSESIHLYADKAVSEFKIPSSGNNEITDLKYNNYQGEIGQMIRDMRDVITDYNRLYAGKDTMSNNWFFSWCIILPDHMKPLKMADYIK